MSWSFLLPVSIPTNVMDIIMTHNQIHWYCKDFDAEVVHVQSNQEDPDQCAGGLMNNGKVLTDVVSKLLTKAVCQLKATIQDTIKKSFEEIAD